MRVFVVIASLVVLASADVSHLNDVPYSYQKPQHGFSQVSVSGSGLAPVSTGYTQQNTVVQQQDYIQPTAGFVHQTTEYVQKPITTTTFVQQQQPAFVQQDVVHTTNGFVGGNLGAVSNNGFSSSNGYSANNGNFNYGNGASYGTVNTGYSGAANSGYGVVNSGFSGAVNGGNYYDSSSYGTNAYSRTTLVKQTAPFITKSSYVFAAPEDQEEIQRDQTIILPRPQQHYKVIFIKAPSTTIVNHPSTALGQQAQEKTLVYVLSDKKRIENNIEVPAVDQVKPQKPEVFFVKYQKPTQVVNSQVEYKTVNAIQGAEHGAVNGEANRVSGGGYASFQDEASSPQQAQIAQQIFQAVQSGGVEGGVQTVNQLIAGGQTITGNFQNQAFDTVSTGVADRTFSSRVVRPAQFQQQTVVQHVPVTKTVVEHVPVTKTVVEHVPVTQTVVQQVPVQNTVVQETVVQESHSPVLVGSTSSGHEAVHTEQEAFKYY